MSSNAELFARFDDAHARYARLREGVGELQRDLDALEATVRSPDGMVTVVVGARGNLKRLTLHDRAYQEHPPQRLAILITEAVRKAETVVTQAVQERIAELVPEGTGLDRVLRRQDERMGYQDGH